MTSAEDQGGRALGAAASSILLPLASQPRQRNEYQGWLHGRIVARLCRAPCETQRHVSRESVRRALAIRTEPQELLCAAVAALLPLATICLTAALGGSYFSETWGWSTLGPLIVATAA